jgi:putative transposase
VTPWPSGFANTNRADALEGDPKNGPTNRICDESPQWRERFVSHGLNAMEEHSPRPGNHPDQLREAVVCEMVRLNQAHPAWGPRKIRELYRRHHQGAEPPSESSFKQVLEQAGLTQPRKRRAARESGRLARGLKAEAPNDVWTVEFKGWWHDAKGQRVEPLTVRDEHSRMVLELRAVEDARTETVRRCFERLFEQHGLPSAVPKTMELTSPCT